MPGDKKSYDLICSLGGNCAAAHNLRYRNMRAFSLPFDWLFIVDDRPIYYLSQGFDNSFNDFCLKENLVELSDDEKSSHHNNRVQYKDTLTQYRLSNHFNKPIAHESEYQRVYQQFQKRFRRLFEQIEKAQSILFILNTEFEMPLDSIHQLQKTLRQKYPDKKIDFEVIQFSCKEEKIDAAANITVRKFRRAQNMYDFSKTNFEWAFLDEIELTQKVKKPPHISIRLLKSKFTIFLERKNKE